jgi:DnaJ-class molecular chaperone
VTGHSESRTQTCDRCGGLGFLLSDDEWCLACGGKGQFEIEEETADISMEDLQEDQRRATSEIFDIIEKLLALFSKSGRLN